MRVMVQPHEGQAELPLAQSAVEDERPGRPQTEPGIAGAGTVDFRKECC